LSWYLSIRFQVTFVGYQNHREIITIFDTAYLLIEGCDFFEWHPGGDWVYQ
jgi:hypothetical protein